MHLLQLFLLLLVLDTWQQFTDRSDNHAQRSFQVMGKVGEELHFRLRLFQNFLFLHTLQLQAILNAEEVDGPDHQYQTEQDIERLCPRSIVPGRNDMNLQCISPVRWFSISVQLTHQ